MQPYFMLYHILGGPEFEICEFMIELTYILTFVKD